MYILEVRDLLVEAEGSELIQIQTRTEVEPRDLYVAGRLERRGLEGIGTLPKPQCCLLAAMSVQAWSAVMNLAVTSRSYK